MSEEPTVRYELHEAVGVGVVRLDRPEILNALDASMSAELCSVLRRADDDPASGALVITGAGRAFCAGGDIRNMGVGPSAQRVVHRDSELHGVIRSLDKPLIAMVNGPAIGLGLSIALACDVVYVAADAILADTHVPLGVVAGDGVMLQMLLDVGPARTRELLLSATRLRGDEAARIGVVNRSFDSEQLEFETIGYAAELAALPRYAVRATKAVIDRQVRWATRQLLDHSLALEEIAMNLPEHGEAVSRYRTGRVQVER